METGDSLECPRGESSFVNLREIAETAVLLSQYAVARTSQFSAAQQMAFESYWSQSRLREQCWRRALSAPEQSGLASLVEEIAVSEILTRVVAATMVVAARRDESTRSVGMAALARRLDEDHRETRYRAVEQLRSHGGVLSEQLRVERLLRRVERWIDMLLAPAVTQYELHDLVFDVDRVADFAEAAVHDQWGGHAAVKFDVMMAALRAAIPNRVMEDPLRSAIHAEIVRAAVGLMPTTMFHPQGPPRRKELGVTQWSLDQQLRRDS